MLAAWCNRWQGIQMRGRCGRLGPVQRHLMSITCERIPGFTPPERDKAWEQGYHFTTLRNMYIVLVQKIPTQTAKKCTRM